MFLKNKSKICVSKDIFKFKSTYVYFISKPIYIKKNILHKPINNTCLTHEQNRKFRWQFISKHPEQKDSSNLVFWKHPEETSEIK